jgi:hypothetical protein
MFDAPGPMAATERPKRCARITRWHKYICPFCSDQHESQDQAHSFCVGPRVRTQPQTA